MEADRPLVVNTLIGGMTGSGKSYLAMHLLRNSDRAKLIFDPKLDPDFKAIADLHTDQEAEFLETVWGSEDCDVAIDEAHQVVGVHNLDFIAMATMARSWGHRLFWIMPQVIGFAPAARNQCMEIYAFRMGPESSKQLKEVFAEPEFELCHKLKRYQFYHLQVWGPNDEPLLRVGTLDTTQDKIIWLRQKEGDNWKELGHR